MRHLCFIIFVLFILLGCFGCNTEKQATKKVSWLLAHDKMAGECARLYPNRDSTVTDTLINFDTLYVENEVYLNDTIYREGQVIYVTKKCPPHEIVTKTIYIRDTIYRTNTAEVDLLKSLAAEKDRQIKEKDDIVIKQQKKISNNDWWRLACIITWSLFIIGGLLKLFVFHK